MGLTSLPRSKSPQRKGFGALLLRPAGRSHSLSNAYPPREPTTTARTCVAEKSLETLSATIFFSSSSTPDESPAIVSIPYSGEVCYLPPRRNFFLSCQELAAHLWPPARLLFILDEVQVRHGRTVRGWASEHAASRPDILCSAKMASPAACPRRISPWLVSTHLKHLESRAARKRQPHTHTRRRRAIPGRWGRS